REWGVGGGVWEIDQGSRRSRFLFRRYPTDRTDSPTPPTPPPTPLTYKARRIYRTGDNMAGNLIDYRVEKGVAILELNDPPANTYTYEMNKELDTCILNARMDDDVYVIVLRGSGDKFFSAGANIKMLSEVTPQFKYYFCLHANETLNRLEQTPKLVIAALNGHTVGGGLEIAMAADIRIALEGAGKVGLPEVTLGVLPGTGGTQRLSRLVGKTKSIELMVEGGLFDFEEALRLGVVNYVWPAEQDGKKWWDRVMEYAWSFCPPNKAARAVGRIKRSVQSGWEIPFESALAIERELQQQLFQSDDAKEGLAAYNQKRKPQFAGK
ncbi:MAG TPA: enoyl-CoA hydratase-related protein, partial [Thermoanaerobaculia bacterium]|nr:enoyl-CoA hydratase-related protein [Thermoanaerobaculia bacterium]